MPIAPANDYEDFTVGKHSSPRSTTTGSLFSAFKAPKKKSGRHSPQRARAAANTAGGVLTSVRSRPVLSAFIVPTVATAAVVASSLAMVPDSTDGGQQVVAKTPVVAKAEVTQSPDEFLAKAKKQAKEKPGKISLESKTETPSPTPSESASEESTSEDSATGDSGSKKSTPDANDEPSKSGDSAGQSGSCPMSYYGGGDGFDGKQTANGESFDTNKLTAAHKTLPFGSEVKITNTANGQSVTVRINDRGPYHGSRCIDLSKAAMEAVGGIGAGQITGKYEVQ